MPRLDTRFCHWFSENVIQNWTNKMIDFYFVRDKIAKPPSPHTAILSSITAISYRSPFPLIWEKHRCSGFLRIWPVNGNKWLEFDLSTATITIAIYIT